MSMLPPSRPKASRTEIEKAIKKAKITDSVVLVGDRGYYERTMGDPTKNDRKIYDDALFIVSPEAFVSFNANVDPSVYRRGVAVLEPGVWRYKPGSHGISFNRPGYPYPAFVQAAEVTVRRDGVGLDTGWFGINIHKGSNTTTSSLGCQTVPPAQWDLFRDLLNRELKANKQKTFPYLLLP